MEILFKGLGVRDGLVWERLAVRCESGGMSSDAFGEPELIHIALEVVARICVFTQTPDGEFVSGIVDRHACAVYGSAFLHSVNEYPYVVAHP